MWANISVMSMLHNFAIEYRVAIVLVPIDVYCGKEYEQMVLA